VRGYKEEGTTTTPFDIVMLNDLDRFRLVMDVIDRVPGLAGRYAGLRQRMADARLNARAYTRQHGEDDPAISGWAWPYLPDGTRREVTAPTGAAAGDTGDDNQSAGGEDALAASG
jgi:xylulose-5-phosphate/fructose-6-phosphate phosphoketolase